MIEQLGRCLQSRTQGYLEYKLLIIVEMGKQKKWYKRGHEKWQTYAM